MIEIIQERPERVAEADPLSRASCLHELFEAQVAATPHAVALVVGRTRLTYRDVNLRANQVAHHLRSLGVGPEVLVGIFLERSADMVMAILGVLKAGGAYVPLDPAYPPERLGYMLKDARAHVMLTQSSLLGTVQDLAPATGLESRIVCVDTDPRLARAPSDNPPSLSQARNLAYVIYTSGSTGQPKGVALEHRNAVALVQWAGQVYSRHELDGVLAGISISFDPSILDLFLPLCFGGKVILAANPLALPGLAAAAEVRMLTTVPSVMRELLRLGGLPLSVETVNLGGEIVSGELVDQLYALPHVKRVYDHYGLTETTTCSTYMLRAPGQPATIGRPVAQTQVYVLDQHFRPVRAGAIGELFIGGAGVARGYLNQPEITAKRFVRLSPVAGNPMRLYRTGDLCRCRPDGNLEFVGRLDRQVKIRGFRIEPGEIEAVLLAHPLVSEAIVIAHEEAPGERRLAAYVVPRVEPGGGSAETSAAAANRIVPQVRSHLEDHLPNHMLPSTIILLDRLPLTTNGKVSLADLPAPVRSRGAAGDYLAPHTPTEEVVCRVWAGLLGLEHVGINDDFFELGGDSLLRIAMFAELQEKTGLKLPMEAMQQACSAKRLAALLDGTLSSRHAAPNSPWVEVQRQGSRPPLFLVHGVGGGMLWGYANLARHLGTDQPVYAFKACDLDRLAEFDTIEKVAAHYVQALRRFQPEGPYALGGYCFGGNVAYEMARQLDRQGQRVSLLALMNSSPPNSSYRRTAWTPLHLYKYLRNLGHWVDGFMQWKFAKQRRFVRWKFAGTRKRASQWIWPSRTDSFALDLDEALDLSAVPNDQRCLWESHVRALDRHQTGPYDGKVVLLRTRGHPLNSSFDRRCGWGEFALREVTVRIVPGWHENMLEEPQVKALARELQAQLDEIAAAPDAFGHHQQG